MPALKTALIPLSLLHISWLLCGLLSSGQAYDQLYVVSYSCSGRGASCHTLDDYMANPAAFFNRSDYRYVLLFPPGGVYTTTHKNVRISGLKSLELTNDAYGTSAIVVCIDVILTDVESVSINSLTLSASGGCNSPRIIFSRVSTLYIGYVIGGSISSSIDSEIDCAIFPFMGTVGISGNFCTLALTADNTDSYWQYNI